MRPAGLWAAALLLAALARAQTGDTCWLNGARVVPGERVPAGDQCNVCACVANSLVCTSRACPSASPVRVLRGPPRRARRLPCVGPGVPRRRAGLAARAPVAVRARDGGLQSRSKNERNPSAGARACPT